VSSLPAGLEQHLHNLFSTYHNPPISHQFSWSGAGEIPRMYPTCTHGHRSACGRRSFEFALLSTSFLSIIRTNSPLFNPSTLLARFLFYSRFNWQNLIHSNLRPPARQILNTYHETLKREWIVGLIRLSLYQALLGFPSLKSTLFLISCIPYNAIQVKSGFYACHSRNRVRWSADPTVSCPRRRIEWC
jgi:hypothetical protein